MYGRLRLVICLLMAALCAAGFQAARAGSTENAAGNHAGVEGAATPSGEHAAAGAGEAPGPLLKLSVTRHTYKLPDGGALDYTATAGYMRLKDEAQKPRADIFFVAYTVDGRDKVSRPLTFLFNGGPGASSAWLHMGVAGPMRVITDGDKPPAGPPYAPVHNPYSWLPWTDLVFIDPVGTGFSRAIPPQDAKHFWNVKSDVQSVGDFIRLYTSTCGRWPSVKYLAGESYGGMRAAGLLSYLYRNFGMEIDGLVLISPALDLKLIQPDSANDLPYVLFLPSYAATAWYHKKIAPRYRGASLSQVLEEAEKWAVGEYMPALVKGDLLDEPEKERIAEKFAALTGLPQTLVRNSDLRVGRRDFTAELLRSEGLSLGFLDGRTVLPDGSGGFLNDPGMAQTFGPYAAALNEYLTGELKFAPGIAYIAFSNEANSQWDWGSMFPGRDALDSIRKALDRNRRLRILAAGGYFDLDVPYFGTSYTMNHIGAAAGLRQNITVRFFPGGHMFYTSSEAIEAFTGEAARFFGAGAPGAGGKNRGSASGKGFGPKAEPDGKSVKK